MHLDIINFCNHFIHSSSTINQTSVLLLKLASLVNYDHRPPHHILYIFHRMPTKGDINFNTYKGKMLYFFMCAVAT